jgi:hypothetical protein
MAAPAVRESWAIAVHEALVGFRDVLMGQLVPDERWYELVLTTRESPPADELVEALRGALAPVLAREDSALCPDDPGPASWRFYPSLDARDREVLARLDWRRAVVVHEWVD